MVPTKTRKPRSDRIVIVNIAPLVRPFCPFGGSLEQTKFPAVILLVSKNE
jgi:hypothetical protein